MEKDQEDRDVLVPLRRDDALDGGTVDDKEYPDLVIRPVRMVIFWLLVAALVMVIITAAYTRLREYESDNYRGCREYCASHRADLRPVDRSACIQNCIQMLEEKPWTLGE